MHKEFVKRKKVFVLKETSIVPEIMSISYVSIKELIVGSLAIVMRQFTNLIEMVK